MRSLIIWARVTVWIYMGVMGCCMAIQLVYQRTARVLNAMPVPSVSTFGVSVDQTTNTPQDHLIVPVIVALLSDVERWLPHDVKVTTIHGNRSGVDVTFNARSRAALRRLNRLTRHKPADTLAFLLKSKGSDKLPEGTVYYVTYEVSQELHGHY